MREEERAALLEAIAQMKAKIASTREVMGQAEDDEASWPHAHAKVLASQCPLEIYFQGQAAELERVCRSA